MIIDFPYYVSKFVLEDTCPVMRLYPSILLWFLVPMFCLNKLKRLGLPKFLNFFVKCLLTRFGRGKVGKIVRAVFSLWSFVVPQWKA
ncbi:hypothetical protein VNO77_21728 [Canavalia gladiata]|uniref:Uncharacterized protein n=1 Tax=Canavalia gladiata TaxID=3824 RepID=A0AAN9L1R5_CANGL